MPRGGKRTGKGPYGNRTDMNRPQAVQAAPSKVYGQGVAQEASQRAVPVAAPPAQRQAVAPATPAAGAPPGPPPGGMGDLLRPTERPDEPMTAGMSLGAGPGPEALGQMFQDPAKQDLMAFAPYLPTLELLANLPESSVETRNFVRRLRGSMPLDTRLER